MKINIQHIFHHSLLGIAYIIALLVCVPTSAIADEYYSSYYAAEQYYEGEYMEYYGYESNVQDAFASSNPTSSAPSQINGRHNAWGDGYTEDELHPGDPLPIGDHAILFFCSDYSYGSIFPTTQTKQV